MFYAEQRDEYRDQLESMKIDPVTGLKNRVALEEDLPRAFSRGNLGVLYIDVNGLNRVNKLDEKHAAGDAYLGVVAQSLKSQLRFGEDVYRGGDKSDEFIVLMPNANAESISGFIDRIREVGQKAIEAMHLPEGIYPGISVGGAVTQEGDTTPDMLLKRADAHCNEEKNRFYDAILTETGRDLRR